MSNKNKKIELDIVGLSYSQTQNGAYTLVLGEQDGRRRLPIIIGGFEAQAIAIEIEKLKPSRPLTHDLFKSMSAAYSIDVKEAIIYNLVDGIFYAKLICSNGNGETEIDARTSDAIAIAVRFDCPIYTYEFILSSAGIIIDGDDFQYSDKIEGIEGLEGVEDIEATPPARQKDLSKLSLDDLNEFLDDAVKGENYERAAQIRDELNRRTS
ncbi:bifunctional nuclease family protein [bacterium AH-315-C07]|nr:bifunctional nuclease family protein [bacterium AH-315-C07]